MIKSKYPVTINPVDNDGYVVQVGCKQLAYTDEAKLGRDLAAYFRDPEKAIAKFYAAKAKEKARRDEAEPVPSTQTMVDWLTNGAWPSPVNMPERPGRAH